MESRRCVLAGVYLRCNCVWTEPSCYHAGCSRATTDYCITVSYLLSAVSTVRRYHSQPTLSHPAAAAVAHGRKPNRTPDHNSNVREPVKISVKKSHTGSDPTQTHPPILQKVWELWRFFSLGGTHQISWKKHGLKWLEMA